MSYRAYTYTEVLIYVLVLLSILYLFRSPVGVTELILVLRNLYLCYGAYTCIEVLVGTTDPILVQRYP